MWNNEIEFLQRRADAIEKVSDTEMYLGFCTPGTQSRNNPSWSICRVTKSAQDGTVPQSIDVMWAEGSRTRDKRLSECETYTYAYRKF